MVDATMSHSAQKPSSSHVKLFSATTLKTTIVTLQGVSALYSVITGLLVRGLAMTSTSWYMGMDVIFVPL